MTAKDLRKLFLDYFKDREHRIVPSSSLIPAGDPTLLFTNAGMVQFKDLFLGNEERSYTRAASVQKCLRVSGKHNDFENVGKTALHHTFFEMLGNFSFGDYFKKEAIDYAWDFITNVCGIPEDQLLVSVFREDNEAYSVWKDAIGVPEEKIFRYGEAENFWAMGDTGPRGPCSEIHFDQGKTLGCGRETCDPNCDCGRHIEIWNLVFMTLDRDDQGHVTPLKSPSVDTGMGLERLAAIIQGKTSNYDTDLFRPIIDYFAETYGFSYGRDPETDMALRVIADHARALAFLVADGLVPTNEGRGYVLRRIMRRAARFGKQLGIQEPFFFSVASFVAEWMKDAYPELLAARSVIEEVSRLEEERFSTTLSLGIKMFDKVCSQVDKTGEKVIPGGDVFRLFDTYGLPLDFTKDMASDRGYAIDEACYVEEMEKQRRRARESWKGEKETEVDPALLAEYHSVRTDFLGYEQTVADQCRVLLLISEGKRIREAEAGMVVDLVLDKTPFYAEAGGQVGDIGQLSGEGCLVSVSDTFSPVRNVIVHRGILEEGALSEGRILKAVVDEEKRQATARHHTATHLLHSALRELLGPHVKQAGSLVAPERFRFDFSHYTSLDMSQIHALEDIINRRILENRDVVTTIETPEQAITDGAMALFGEKYAETVRVVTIPGVSKELCGGTHARKTGDIGLLLITSESSIAAGVRRIEGQAGIAALAEAASMRTIIQDLCGSLKVGREQLQEHLERLLKDSKEKEKEISRLKLQAASGPVESGFFKERTVGGFKIAAARAEQLNQPELRAYADDLKNRLAPGVAVVGTVKEGKSMLVVASAGRMPETFDAGKIVNQIAPMVGGRGGGRRDMAQAGGKESGDLNQILEKALDLIEEVLK